MSAAVTRPDAAPEASRLPTLLWLFWRFLPPLDSADRRTLTAVGSAGAYLAVPLTVGLAAPRMPAVTLLSLICLAVPAVPVWWWGAVQLGARRRDTALALRQARINTRAAAATSISRQLAYPAVGAILGTLLIGFLHRPLAEALPQHAPLAEAIRSSAGRWMLAAPAAVLLLVALTALLSGPRAAVAYTAVRRVLARLDRREAARQPQ